MTRRRAGPSASAETRFRSGKLSQAHVKYLLQILYSL